MLCKFTSSHNVTTVHSWVAFPLNVMPRNYISHLGTVQLALD